MGLTRRLAVALARAVLSPAERDALAGLRFRDAGHGYDRLGMSAAAVGASLAATRFFYERYFRVESHGAEHLPREGAAILAPNHSGMLPVDAMMLWADVLRRTDPMRAPRVVADTFVPRLPFVYTLFSRSGAVAGNRATVDGLVRDGELVVIFPEGTPGIGKPRSERYRLRPFRVGHAELAVRHGAPIVPVAILGAEEQWPELARIESFHAFGAPYLPIPATPLPLPVRYHLHYGAPIATRPRFSAAQCDDPRVTRALAAEVQAAVQALIDEGLRTRDGVFG